MAAAVVSYTEATAIPQTIIDSVMVGKSYFSRVNPTRHTPKVFEGLENQILQLSAKQVPSCTLLRKTGSRLLDNTKDALLKAGFELESPSGEVVHLRDVDTRSETMRSKISSQSDVLKHLLTGERRTILGELVSPTPGIEADDLEYKSNLKELPSHGWKVHYHDPWKIMGYVAYKEFKGESLPEILSWPGDIIRLQDNLPPRLFSKAWASKHKNRIRFADLADVEEKINFLKHRTFWGSALEEHCRGVDEVATWARKLRYRIARFLRGYPDPNWNRKAVDRAYKKPENDKVIKKSLRARSLRFLELLKTIDGAFSQRILAYPEEEWTWAKFDNFVLYMLSHLLSDEFFDGELTAQAVEQRSFFQQLKSARKTFKLQSHTRLWDAKEYPGWLPWYPAYAEVLKKTPDGHRYAFLIGMLSQTRGCGTPPPIVVLQSKIKFLKTVTVKPPPLTWEEGLIRWAAEAAIAEVPGDAFTGLDTKGRIVIATSACWEKTRREGGTLETIMEVIQSYYDYIPFYDWDTGKSEGTRHISEFENIGQVALHACYSEVIKTPLDELRRAYLTIVKEPGKGRVVTKANASLKIVLDFVNKICAEPLKKGFASSTSGMGKSNHGWNAFINDFRRENADTLFNLSSRDVEELAESDFVRDEYHDCLALSTDYSEATDFMHHRVGEILGRYWMQACGIPKPFQGLCVAVCFRPREVYFSASGPLAAYGVSAPAFGKDIRMVMLERGILMGDPLTKIVLHLTNICVRKIADKLGSLTGLDAFITNAGELGDALFDESDPTHPFN